MSKLQSYLSAVLALSRLSRVPDVMFKACVAAQGWPSSRNVLLAFPFLALHMNEIVPNSLGPQCVLGRFFPWLKSTSVKPLSFKGSEDVTDSSHPLMCLCMQR